ncbi:hypothetical protein JCM8547_001051 [Rhodosporidiobolus lusitaniae]
MSKFVTREITVPDSQGGEADDNEAVDPGWARGPGGGEASGGTAASQATGAFTGAAPLPALPTDLLDALAREPPAQPSPSASSGSIQSSRTSLSFNRSLHPPSSAKTSTSPSLPPLSPQSPFGLPPYPPSSPSVSLHSSLSGQRSPAYPPSSTDAADSDQAQLGFSTNRTASAPPPSSPGSGSALRPPLSSSHSHSYSGSSPSHSPNNLPPPVPAPFSSSRTPPATASPPHPPPLAVPSSRRNMFKSLSAFGSRRQAPVAPSPAAPSTAPSSPTLDRKTGQGQGQQQQPVWGRSPSASSVAPYGSIRLSASVGALGGEGGTHDVPSVSPGTFAISPPSAGSPASSPSRQRIQRFSGAEEIPSNGQGGGASLPRSASAPFRTVGADDFVSPEWNVGVSVGVRAGAGRRRAGTVGAEARAGAGGGLGMLGGGGGGGEEYTRDLERDHVSEEDEEEESEMEGGEGRGEGEREEDATGEFAGKDGEREEGEEEEERRRKLAELDLGAGTTPAALPPRDFVIAIIGPRNVGKSTVIRKGLKSGKTEKVVLMEDAEGNRVTSLTTLIKVLDLNRRIQVLEIDQGLLEFSSEGVVWPEGVPRCEGAMLCYDSTDPSSLTSLSLLLRAFWIRGSGIPLVVLGCKASPPVLLSSPTSPTSPTTPTSSQSPSQAKKTSAVDPNEASRLSTVYGARGLIQLDGGAEDREKKAQPCWTVMVQMVMQGRGELDTNTPTTASSSSPPASRRVSLRSTSLLPSVSSAPLAPSSSTITDPTRPRLPRGDSLSNLSSAAGAGGQGLGLSVVQEAPVGRVEGGGAVSGARGGAGEAEEEDPAARAKRELDEEVERALQAALGGSSTADEKQKEDNDGLSRARPVTVTSTMTGASSTGTGGGGPRDPMRGQVVLPSKPVAIAQTLGPERRGSKGGALDLYFKGEDVIDKFLFAAVSGNDEQFVTLFLITYRRFARPFDVLEKLIARFEFVASRHKTDPLLSRFGQMKLCGVLATWMTHYPGDFTAPATFELLQPFLESLLPRGATWVAHYALELGPMLAEISARSDPEVSWALPDKAMEEGGDEGRGGEAFSSSPSPYPRFDSPSIPSAPSVSSVDVDASAPSAGPSAPAPATMVRRPSLSPSFDSSSSLAPSSSAHHSVPLSKSISRLSAHTGGSLDTPDTGLSPSLSFNGQAFSSAGGFSPRPASEAGTMDTQDSSASVEGEGAGGKAGVGKPLDKRLSTLIMVSDEVLGFHEDTIATQITRKAWETFGGMSPRDLMRHVLAPRDPNNPRVALRNSESNVMRSIAFVNYLANWVSSLILIQSKPSRRARMVEKLIKVAASLREQENYDSLMGVLAGLNAQPIFRLSETFELVAVKMDEQPRADGQPLPPARTEQPDGDKTRLPKKLRSLNRLMSANQAFKAYRMAVSNSGVNLIPYLGVHLQDITTIHEVKPDLRDSLVNWSKFQQMGRAAAIVLDCQRVAPTANTLPRDRVVERCLMDVPVMDEEEMYRKSYEYQPRGGGGAGGRRGGTRDRIKGVWKSTKQFATE